MQQQLNYAIDMLDKVSFKQIFLFWIGYMFLFGIFFYLLSFSQLNGVLYKGAPLENGISGFLTAEYFSFITAASASQGYGDVLPIGASRVLAVIEAVSGLVLFGVIISKLLSQKQEVLLQEVYDISFEERINRIRSALYLFRSDVSKLVEKIDNSAISRRQIDDIWITFTTFESTMYEITKLLQPSRINKYVKHIDDLNLELVLRSVAMSLAKTRDLLAALDEKNHSWRNDTMNSIITGIFINVDNIQNRLKHRESNKKIQDKLAEVLSLSVGLRERTHIMVSVAAA